MIEIMMTPLDIDPAAVHEAATLLSASERARALTFVRPRDRRRFTVTRATLRRELGARLALPPRAVRLATGPFGKPCLAGRQGRATLHFSVSHCNDVAALAFATDREIGVDIEALRRIPDAEVIAGRMCSPAEWRAYAALPEEQRVRGFLNWWTRKEAVLKAQGCGLGGPLDAFDVSLAPGEPARLLRAAHGAGWTLHAFTPGPRLVGAVACAIGRDVPCWPVAGERIVVHPLTRTEAASVA